MAIAIKMDRVPIENEILLWENSDPTEAFAANTSVPLMQSPMDFDKVRIYWYASTTSAQTVYKPYEEYLEIDMNAYNSMLLTEGTRCCVILGGSNDSGTNFYRFVAFSTSETITFGTGKQYNSTTTNNSYCIPYKVTGISRREIIIPSRGNETIDVLWTNPTPNSALAANTEITLAQGAEKYDILRVYHKPATSDTPEVGRWVDFHIDKKPSNFMVRTDQVRMTLADLVGTTTYTRGFWFPYDDGLPAPSSNPDANLYTTIKFGNGCRIANTTTNTSNIIPLIICGVNFVEGSQERIHNNFTVSTTGWSSSTVVFGGEDCYYNDIIITQYDGRTPVISIIADDLLISKNEQLAYKAWKYATINTDTMKLRLYSPTVPANDFTIHVEGVM